MRLWVPAFVGGSLIVSANASQVQAKHARVELPAQQTALRVGRSVLSLRKGLAKKKFYATA